MKRIISAILLISLFVLCGCREQPPDYTLEVPITAETSIEPSTMETTRIKEYREYTTYPVEQPKGNIAGNTYYYSNSRVIRYYDPELRRGVTLCTQPNCTHDDGRCTAYLGGDNSTHYQVSGNMVYAIVDYTESDGRILFVERNMITGESRTLWDLTPEENMVREDVGFSVCDDVVFLAFREFEIDWKSDGTTYCEKNVKNYSYEINLLTGERELLLVGEAPSLEGFYFSGDTIDVSLCTEDFLVINDMDYVGELPMSEETYLQKNPEGDYSDYLIESLRQFNTSSHYSVKRKTGEKKRIYGNVAEAHHQDSACKRDKKVVFTEGDRVCIYDGRTGEVTSYFEQENIGFLNLMDGRIFYNVCGTTEDGSQMYTYFWYDLQTGERKQFQEGVNLMIFALQEETKDYFYGYYNGGMKFISKQDFYNENYDGAF